LIRTYQAVADNPQAVLDHLGNWRPDKDFYYKLRDSPVPANDPAYSAARFIYLNKTCWNGLYRVNGAGKFNVPYGRPKTDNLIDPENLVTCAANLAGPDVTLSVCDFADSLEAVRSGDFVFLDPPYLTRHNNNGFVEYNEQIFSWSDQQRLAKIANDLVATGASVMVTNALHQDVLDLYEGFNVAQVERSSTIASDNSRRGRVTEAVLYRNPGEE
jgi:DNA adenine methylase